MADDVLTREVELCRSIAGQLHNLASDLQRLAVRLEAQQPPPKQDDSDVVEWG